MGLNLFAMEVRIATDLDPTTAGGSSLLKFRVASDRRVKGEKKTSFFAAEAWAKVAELIAQHFKKGDLIVISGSIYVDEWEDKTSGQKRERAVLRVERFDFPGGGNKRDGEGEQGEVRSATKRDAAPTGKATRKTEKARAGGGFGDDDVDRFDGRHDDKDDDSIPF